MIQYAHEAVSHSFVRMLNAETAVTRMRHFPSCPARTALEPHVSSADSRSRDARGLSPVQRELLQVIRP